MLHGTHHHGRSRLTVAPDGRIAAPVDGGRQVTAGDATTPTTPARPVTSGPDVPGRWCLGCMRPVVWQGPPAKRWVHEHTDDYRCMDRARGVARPAPEGMVGRIGGRW
jgi:hypothetical protein